MKKFNLKSKIGIFVGTIWSILFAIRYLVIWLDYSQAIVFISLGFGLILCSILYEMICKLSEERKDDKIILDIIEENMEDYVRSKRSKK